MRRRQGAVVFSQVKGHSGNYHNDAADRLANEGSSLPAVGPYINMNLEDFGEVGTTQIVDNYSMPKVSALYLPTKVAYNNGSTHMDLAGSLIPAHRGHEKLREIKMSLWDSLLGAKMSRVFGK
jgi:hypothetical protein